MTKINPLIIAAGAIGIIGVGIYFSLNKTVASPDNEFLPPVDTSDNNQDTNTQTQDQVQDNGQKEADKGLITCKCILDKNCQRGFIEYDEIISHPYNLESIKLNAIAINKPFDELWENYITRVVALPTLDLTFKKHSDQVSSYENQINTEIKKMYDNQTTRAQIQAKADNKSKSWLEMAIIDAVRIVNKDLRISVGLPAYSPNLKGLSGFRFGFLGI